MKRILIITLFALAALQLNAQQGDIIFRDFEPDTALHVGNPLLGPTEIGIDFDNDDLFDLTIGWYGASTGPVLEMTCRENVKCCVAEEGDTISNLTEWISKPFHPHIHENYAIRINKDGEYYYGWYRTYVNYEPFVINDFCFDKFAFCTIPDYPLLWGQTSLNSAIGENGEPTDIATVQPNPGNGQVRIEAPTEDCVVRFYDLNGRLILAKPFDFATDVDTDHWTPGLYLWEIWNGTQHQASGKWVKE